MVHATPRALRALVLGHFFLAVAASSASFKIVVMLSLSPLVTLSQHALPLGFFLQWPAAVTPLFDKINTIFERKARNNKKKGIGSPDFSPVVEREALLFMIVFFPIGVAWSYTTTPNSARVTFNIHLKVLKLNSRTSKQRGGACASQHRVSPSAHKNLTCSCS
jgi:hypothetical protein